ncbi:hypothetical protein [Kribbella monticola]|uniref:hypothetical protein n=1 Tax=Kribbella monticola TaxID=2185285 RepID=UPI000DD493FF|nr:hypothetical protein [Kribbella monticola]
MNPRPAPSRHDITASRFLDAAAQLIDAMFVGSQDDRPPRLRHLDFPAALEWLRVDDVIRIAQDGGDGPSKKAFHNRWQHKDQFVRDAVIHTMLYRDDPGSNPGTLYAAQLVTLGRAGGFTDFAIPMLDGMLATLLAHPRSFLLMHIGPILDQHPELGEAVLGQIRLDLANWYHGYTTVLEAHDVRLRPGWTVERVGLALSAMLDGFLLRSRIQPEEMSACRWENASLLADAMIAFSVGVVDSDGSGRTSRAVLDDVMDIN